MRYMGRAARMERHHQRHKRSSLNVISLMDIFTILVFFLLVSSSDVDILPSTRDVQLPESIAEERPRETVMVLVTERDVLVQGRLIAQVDDILMRDEIVIAELKEALESQTARFVRQEARDDVSNLEVTILGDKTIPYRLLKKIMATCTDADYGRVSLAVMQKSSAGQLAAAAPAGLR